jgi:hypothetical protein
LALSVLADAEQQKPQHDMVSKGNNKGGISLSKQDISHIKAIKNQFNSKRKVYDFSHLDSLSKPYLCCRGQ